MRQAEFIFLTRYCKNGYGFWVLVFAEVAFWACYLTIHFWTKRFYAWLQDLYRQFLICLVIWYTLFNIRSLLPKDLFVGWQCQRQLSLEFHCQLNLPMHQYWSLLVYASEMIVQLIGLILCLLHQKEAVTWQFHHRGLGYVIGTTTVYPVPKCFSTS